MAAVGQWHGTSRLNDRLAVVVALAVAASAIPFGSNRSVWWLSWSALFAALTCIVALSRMRQRGESPRALAYRGVLSLVLLTLLWAMVQALPLAALMPEGMIRMAPGLQGLAGPALSVQPDVALAGVLRLAGYLLLAGLVIEVAARRTRVLVAGQIVFAAICAQAIWALVALRLLGDISLWGVKEAYLGSATGTFVNRNSLATYLGFGIVLGMGLVAERTCRHRTGGKGRPRWAARLGTGDILIGTGLVFLLLALVMTQSRLGLTASLVGALVTLALIRTPSGKVPVGVVAVAALVCICGLGALAVMGGGQGVAERFLFVGDEAANRLALYGQVLQMIAQRPFTGFGMDAFGSAFQAFRAPPLLGPASYDLAHNSYLTLWVEFGLVFGTLPMLALVLVATQLWQRRRADDGFSGLAVAGLGALVIAALHSLGDFSLEIPANAYLLVFILGLGLGRDLNRASGRTTAPSPHPVAP